MPDPYLRAKRIAILFHRSEEPESGTTTRSHKHVMIQSFQREASQLASRYWMDWTQVTGSRLRPQAGQRSLMAGFEERTSELAETSVATQVGDEGTPAVTLTPVTASLGDGALHLE